MDNITQDDEFHDKEYEPEDEQDLEEYEDTDDDSIVNDEVDNIMNPDDLWSLQIMKGKVTTK